MLKAIKVKKSYLQINQEISVLNDLDFQVEKGQSAAIIGESGSGKSTLLALLGGLDQVDQGEISIAGTTLGGLNEQALSRFRAKHISIVFQQFHLMPQLTALENVSLPLEITHTVNADARSMEALDQVGLADRASHFPHQLSGGEIQRVAIARAIVVKPDLLLADEPSGNLDEITGNKVMSLLFELVSNSKMTTILVTHNQALANRCERQLQLKDGKLWEDS